VWLWLSPLGGISSMLKCRTSLTASCAATRCRTSHAGALMAADRAEILLGHIMHPRPFELKLLQVLQDSVKLLTQHVW
jgi:hypothetical protein